jgi:membrane protein required for colicin V production
VNLFDGLLLGIYIFCLIKGVYRGLMRECVSLIGVMGGFYAASHHYTWIENLLSSWISNEIYLRILGFFSIFLAIVFIFNLMIPAIKHILRLDFIQIVDRSFGGAIGMIKGFIISCILLIAFTAFFPRGALIISGSRLLKPLSPLSEKLVLLVHKDMKHEFFTKIDSYIKAEY